MLDTLSDGLCNVVACQIADIASHVSHAGARMGPRLPWSPPPLGHCCVMCEQGTQDCVTTNGFCS